MKLILNVLCLPLLLFHFSAFSMEMNPYQQLVNDDQNNPLCLALGKDFESVSLQQCEDTAGQQWIFAQSGAMVFIKSMALGHSDKEMCLVALGQAMLKMATCASADPTDYQSKRLWYIGGSDHNSLLNKYIADKGWPNYLQRTAEGTLVFGNGEPAAAKWAFAQPLYEQIVSDVHGLEACLTLADDHASVALQPCRGKDQQQWQFTPSGTRLHVKNKALNGEAEEKCLYAASSSEVKMAACASAGGTDYESHRLWERKGNQPSVLLNKYISDKGQPSALQYTEDRRLVFAGQDSATAKWNISKHYGHVRNIGKGQEYCLALAPNDVDVELAPCSREARQDWSMAVTAGINRLQNRFLASEQNEKCLGSAVKMIDCQGSGFQSERTWFPNRNFIPETTMIGFTLQNKYRNDLGRKEVLGFSGSHVQMVPASSEMDATWTFDLDIPVISKRPMLGDKKILLLHTHYSDRPETDFAEVKRGFFGSENDNYSFVNAVSLASGNKLHFTGDAVTGLDLGPRPADCPNRELMAKAVERALEKGWDAKDYDYLAVEIPPTACSWAGLAATPGNSAMGNGVGWKPWMWQHEFGHSLGGPHAKSLEHCPTQQDVVQVGGDGCTVTGLGDPSDTLNGGGGRLYPLPYQYFAGWVTDEQFPEVLKNGTYKIAPLFAPADAAVIKGLRLFRSDNSYLVLEFRQPLEGFENWDPADPFVNGVIVRVVHFIANTVSNTLVDTTPDSPNGMKDAPLMQGKQLDDLLSGKRITVLHIDKTGATVEIADVPGHVPFHRPPASPAAERREEVIED
ncbi:ricin-type beta-trefoil lectin domain protein [Pantoea sp. Ap-967]|uniref:ricin-type beta-trefoil lectin domain protein n=1 Tax=Pantoea sp. Ap-967 TaxID=2608362 RepID=UPI0014232013|nr:ricin-type beta-trefoil lectin domain protein [Pantoea sp. Ap-967]NIE77075.1 ricin-type beta-trefoil lectin domain protein [Pantoea sp. Ap-967]